MRIKKSLKSLRAFMLEETEGEAGIVAEEMPYDCISLTEDQCIEKLNIQVLTNAPSLRTHLRPPY